VKHSVGRISVAVAANRSPELLRACLASLVPQCRAHGADLIVVRTGSPTELAQLEHEWPTARFIAAPPDASIPELRGLGLQAASGDFVALTEDHCVAAPDWLSALIEAAGEEVVAVGGGMGNAQTRRAVDWGAYFSEYGFFDASRPPGDDALLTAANVAYRRPVLRQVTEGALAGDWENVLHGRLQSQGLATRFAARAVVRQNRTYQLGDFCRDRFEHGRDYARARLAEAPGTSRWMRTLACVALPFVLTLRVARAAGRGAPGAFLRALPATFTFLAAWSVGEVAGYLHGGPPAVEAPGRRVQGTGITS
jgi:glycosyltransferase involved in cell wall biosynthesis